jgi:GR25 family glycosyltransferase involved in LPS biosynthesis
MYWDCIYILNLDRIKHKYEEVLERLFQVGITPLNTTIVRWRGLDGSTKLPFSKEIYSIDDIDRKKDLLKKMNTDLQKKKIISENVKTNFRPGQIGVYLSFIQIIEHAIINNYKKILILEDDVFFVSDFIKKYQEVNDMKQDIIFLGTSHKYWNKKNKTDKNVSWYCPEKIIDNTRVDYPLGCINLKNDEELNNGFLGTFGYVLNESAYSKILKDAMPMRYSFDIFIGKLFNKKKITVAFLKDTTPTSVLLAKGSEVSVFKGKVII